LPHPDTPEISLEPQRGIVLELLLAQTFK